MLDMEWKVNSVRGVWILPPLRLIGLKLQIRLPSRSGENMTNRNHPSIYDILTFTAMTMILSGSSQGHGYCPGSIIVRLDKIVGHRHEWVLCYNLTIQKKSSKRNMQVLKVAQFECLSTALPNSFRPSKVPSTFLSKQFFVQSFFSTSVVFYVLNY